MHELFGVHVWLACRYPFSEDQAIPDCDWEVFLRETAAMIVEQQSPQRSAIYSPTYIQSFDQ